MRLKKKFKFVIERTETGFSAYSEDTPVYTTGRNITELENNILEALELTLDAVGAKFSKENLEFQIDIKQFFKYYRVINAKYLAERIGMNPAVLSQYVKGHKKPSTKQTTRILNGLNEIGRELANLHLLA